MLPSVDNAPQSRSHSRSFRALALQGNQREERLSIDKPTQIPTTNRLPLAACPLAYASTVSASTPQSSYPLRSYAHGISLVGM